MIRLTAGWYVVLRELCADELETVTVVQLTARLNWRDARVLGRALTSLQQAGLVLMQRAGGIRLYSASDLGIFANGQWKAPSVQPSRGSIPKREPRPGPPGVFPNDEAWPELDRGSREQKMPFLGWVE